MTVSSSPPPGGDGPSRDGAALAHRTTPDALPDVSPDVSPGAAAALRAAAPWGGFAEAADAVLALLQDRLGMDLWAVTQVRGEHQEVLVARSAGFPVPPGAVLPWAESFCSRMVAGAPRIAPRVRAVPAYASAGFGDRYRIGAYVGVPLVDEDGGLFGTLCAMSAQEQPARLADELALVEVLARQLSTLLAKERLAADRSASAAAAYALVERDPTTGLLNRRGWEAALEAEEARCARTGRDSAVAVVRLPVADEGRAVEVARLLEASARRSDRVARTGTAEFALLAPEGGAEGLDAWTHRLLAALGDAGGGVRTGAASRAGAGSVAAAWSAAAASCRHRPDAEPSPAGRRPDASAGKGRPPS